MFFFNSNVFYINFIRDNVKNVTPWQLPWYYNEEKKLDYKKSYIAYN